MAEFMGAIKWRSGRALHVLHAYAVTVLSTVQYMQLFYPFSSSF